MRGATSCSARMTDRDRDDIAATLDAGERTCAALIASIRDAIAPLQPGEVLAVTSRDPSARLDLPAWCRMTGHVYLDVDERDDHTMHYLRKRG